jgi:hypothetical protein
MLKTENSTIFTCEDESYFFCFTFANNKRVLLSASAKGIEICVDSSTCIIFWYFMLLCMRIFLFSHKNWRSKYVFMGRKSSEIGLHTIFSLLTLFLFRYVSVTNLCSKYGLFSNKTTGLCHLRSKRTFA